VLVGKLFSLVTQSIEIKKFLEKGKYKLDWFNFLMLVLNLNKFEAQILGKILSDDVLRGCSLIT